MKVEGLNGREYILSLSNTESGRASALHKRVRAFLKGELPYTRIYEEVFLPGCPTKLYLDFLVPAYKLGIECQGEQHNEYSQFFHKDRLGFTKSLKRDRYKADFCELNGITMLSFYEDQTEEIWRQIINHRK